MQSEQPETTEPSAPSPDIHHSRTIYVGDLNLNADEDYIYSLFAEEKESILKVKVFHRTPGRSAFSFVEFDTQEAAKASLDRHSHSGFKPDPNGPVVYHKLNWSIPKTRPTPPMSVFVANLDPNVTQDDLLSLFRSKYDSVVNVYIARDKHTQLQLDYGFVDFRNGDEAKRALVEMQGHVLFGRALKINRSSNHRNVGTPKPSVSSGQRFKHIRIQQTDPRNSTVFVGGLAVNVTADMLQNVFASFGPIVHTRVLINKSCGFIHYRYRHSAEEAIVALNGSTVIPGSRLKLDYGTAVAVPLNPNVPGQECFDHRALMRMIDRMSQNGTQSVPTSVPPHSEMEQDQEQDSLVNSSGMRSMDSAERDTSASASLSVSAGRDQTRRPQAPMRWPDENGAPGPRQQGRGYHHSPDGARDIFKSATFLPDWNMGSDGRPQQGPPQGPQGQAPHMRPGSTSNSSSPSPALALPRALYGVGYGAEDAVFGHNGYGSAIHSLNPNGAMPGPIPGPGAVKLPMPHGVSAEGVHPGYSFGMPPHPASQQGGVYPGHPGTLYRE
ncbi:hypothetical protein KIPB_008185 [Kipferlia bialata]|uniref:RRM domain-containing protein n=1 Tax=Kipferlia bialata TaxID=797122 RepID=A0A9K3D154_9EUKA|nr:hypothetical protein KIPB_008185 [Kipferlia bialata]|eukprot:g8185.t1